LECLLILAMMALLIMSYYFKILVYWWCFIEHGYFCCCFCWLKEFQEHKFFNIVFMDLEKTIIHTLKLGPFNIDFNSSFWNGLFEKKLPKYKDRLQAIHSCPLLQTININKTSSHLFNQLQNLFK
jgi:hypothetical protein